MKVEELIIDGFKSYATRTVVSDWDPQFNAITGLNGSGKSNILDAICFVLGIASMTTVRASSLQDLIYKRGQAGVTKASVTIVFDNSEKDKSPIGFENSLKISVTRQIILGGSSKYLVNGHKAQQQTVLSLFQSVQLNINNPNFLIMQGKITKVLNMKPQEILSLIEEAAGTKTFEDRKDKAIKTMQKKEAKLMEIRNLLKEEIEPKLEKFRSEKRIFLEYNKIQIDLERIQRIVKSYNYKKYSSNFDIFSTKKSENEAVISELQRTIERLGGEIANLNADLDQVKEQKKAEQSGGSRIEALAKLDSELSDDITRLRTTRDLTLENLAEENALLDLSCRQREALELDIEKSLETFRSFEENHQQVKEKFAQMTEEFNQKEELYSTLSTGVTAKGGFDGGYISQLKALKEELSGTQRVISQLNLKLLHLRDKVAGDSKRISQAKVENASLMAEMESYKREISEKEAQFEKYGFNPKAYQAARDQESLVRKQIAEFNQQLNHLKREIGGNVEFTYSKPYSNFNSDSVKGTALQLFTLSENSAELALALQVCAGGRLYNVVVDNSNTASALLERGNLKRRVTIIPLDKISARRVSPDKVQYAADKCPGKVELAINLIEFDQNVEKAMEYIFGTTFICRDPGSAKDVTFDARIRARSITLDGDIYDPEGNLSGGSRRNNSSILLKTQKYNTLLRQTQQYEAKQRDMQEQLAKMEALSESTKQLQTELNLSKHEMSLLQRKLDNSGGSGVIREHEANMQEIAQLEADVREAESRTAELEVQISSVNRDIEEFQQDKGLKLQELGKEIKALKSRLQQENAKVKQNEEQYENLQLEVDQKKVDLGAASESIEAVQNSIIETQRKVTETEQKLVEVEERHLEVRTQLDDERAKVLGLNEEIGELNKIITEKSEQQSQAKLQAQKLSHDLEKSAEATESIRRKLDLLIAENEWLADENVVAGIIQQYPDINVDEYESQGSILAERIQNMKRKVNPNIMNMIDNVEKKEAALIHMIRTIEKDKSKIENTIDKLNNYKRDTLDKTYRKVSTDFGDIFADLLPGSFAKLVPINPLNVTLGLAVKVKLGPVWKESLVELSGGQRSLVALSLIMALLQFKPAPMYILDEVDAALDLSHTQNIGHLIKTRFRGSQFIVVSLKEGMFTNANRVFRTRFQDGTSMVSAM